MKKLILVITIALAGIFPALMPIAPVWADSQTEVCAGIGLTGSDCKDKATADNGVKGLGSTIVNILSLIVGIAAVIMIIIGGLKYVTSNGDSNSISSAKNTLLYALIGLFVAAIAQLLVHFVLGAVGK